MGDRALTVELGDAIDPALNSRVLALDASLRRAALPGVRETVPTYRSLLVVYDPAAIAFRALAGRLEALAAADAAPAPAGRLHEVPTCYGGDAGPDLPEVARATRLSERDVVALHASVEYTAFMLGFRPGFAYLGVLPAALVLPRRTTPRTRVPAGSVAIAGEQTGIYPSASPGGWHLIGRTAFRAFDAAGDPPAILAPGDRVRFVPVPELPDVVAPAPPLPVPGTMVLEVLQPGLFTTVQARPRLGHRRFGVSIAGPLDTRAHDEANRILGNPEDSATLECTVVGAALRFLAPTRLAVTGADLGAMLARRGSPGAPLPLATSLRVEPGDVLSFGARRAGARAYVAFAGGLVVPAVLGSRSTDAGAGFGGLAGRRLRRGDGLSLGPPSDRMSSSEWRAPDACARVRVVLGPQDDHFEPAVLRAFLDSAWRVGPVSDRSGCRLEGPRLAHRGTGEIVSDGLVPGAIQVPPDGAPIVVLADGPTTGGYPKIATVVSADLPLLAQLVPGEGEVRFRAVSVEEAQG